MVPSTRALGSLYDVSLLRQGLLAERDEGPLEAGCGHARSVGTGSLDPSEGPVRTSRHLG